MDKPILRMNLQLFNDGEGESIPTEAIETTETDFQTEWDAQFDDNAEESTEETDELGEPAEFDYKPFLSKLGFKHNDEEYKYDNVESLIADAQKGKDYDRIREQRDNLKSDPRLEWLDSYMKKSGFTDTKLFLEAVQKNERETEIDNYAQDLINRGWDEQQAKLYASTELERQKLASGTQNIESTNKRQSELQKFSQFFEEKQGVALNGDNIPDYVRAIYDENKGNITSEQLELAYYRNNVGKMKLETEQETIKKINEKKLASTGPVSGESNTTSTITADQIEKILGGMSASQQASWIESNYDKIEKSGYFKS